MHASWLFNSVSIRVVLLEKSRYNEPRMFLCINSYTAEPNIFAFLKILNKKALKTGDTAQSVKHLLSKRS